MSDISSLKPNEIWKYFEEILEIPRPSKDESKIRNYLKEFARKNGLSSKTDEAGNLLIIKKASKGHENKKPVLLQSHLDMVGEKNAETHHDFSSDPIIPRIDGDWVKATGTTLGADCGIGIAAQMAVLASKEIEHGPLECLFTVDEETGLTGAMALQPDFFESKILLNLDSEDEGELFIGCAGGIDTIAEFKYKTRIFPNKHSAYKINISGLAGGHSGDEIHRSPGGNSNKILTRFLWNAGKKFEIRLSEMDGGNLRNAIPREAFALFAVPNKDKNKLEEYFEEFQKEIKEELKHTEKKLSLSLKQVDHPETVINLKLQERFLNSLYICPNGVVKWSKDLEGLVETSTNLASVKFPGNQKILVTTSQRSSSATAIKDISDQVEACFLLAKAKVKHTDGYPGWAPDPNSEILQITARTYKDLFSKEPVVRAIHAGLECGLFLEKYPDLDMISFGPTIKGAHSPDERLSIKTTQKFWDLLLEVLKRIPE